MNHDFVRIANRHDLEPGRGRTVRIQGMLIALFRLDGGVYALDNACAHQGGPLGEGKLDDTLITCPTHGWRFDVKTGECLTVPGHSVATFPVQLDGDDVLVGLPADEEADDATPDRLLVRYGPMGNVALFRQKDPVRLERGTRVVVQSDRGLELGEVLLATHDVARLEPDPPATHWVVRTMTAHDAERERTLQLAAEHAFDDCCHTISRRQTPIELVDAELLFDGKTLILYFLGEPVPELAELAMELTARHQSEVRFRPLGQELRPPSSAHCGPGEGHECGNCQGHGSCSRGTHEET